MKRNELAANIEKSEKIFDFFGFFVIINIRRHKMSYEVLFEQIKSVPQNHLAEIEAFVGYILYQYAGHSVSAPQKRHRGSAKGKFVYPDNFDYV